MHKEAFASNKRESLDEYSLIKFKFRFNIKF